jgi:hypothetical protein
MADRSEVEQIVEKVVSQVLQHHIPQLREDLVRRVMEEVPHAEAGGAGDSGAANLLKAISAIHSGTTQREILRALLDNTVRYSGRGALFVVKAGAATGWQGRGFTENGEDTIKDFALNVSMGAPEEALRSRLPFSGSNKEIDPEFVSRFGGSAADHLLMLPLMLKEKVAALVYADAGSERGGKLDSAALELLVRATSAWLEVASLRKQAQKEDSAEPVAEKAISEKAVDEKPAAPKEERTPAHAAPMPSDPFASHAPKHVAPVSIPVPVAPVVEEQPVAVAHAEPIAVSAAAAAPAPATDPFANLSPEDADVHRKAQRFARLLVDEIKLYNQAKVAEGRKNKDLYDRLREDIEKSRGTFQKRYGNSVAAGADYFSQELVRSLAADDSSVMGANFRRN